MHCRAYRLSDRDGCIRAFRSNTPARVMPEELLDYERFLDALPGPYFAVVDGSGVIGCGGIATGRVSAEADVCWTIVHEAHQRRGAGSLLMRSCVAEILSIAGCETARLDTSQHTRAFFERWGFIATSVAADGYGPGLDRVEMRIILDALARNTWNALLSGRNANAGQDRPPDADNP